MIRRRTSMATGRNACSLVRIFLTCVVLSTFSSITESQESTRLRYGWEPGEKYGYEFNVEYVVDDETRIANGFVTYELERKNVPQDLSGNSLKIVEEGEGTATAFAVSSDGYLLTCAHCVEGAKTIHVRVGEKRMLATVVEADHGLDLAVIKIAASALPVVVLGKSSQIELAQDVRAIGYSLSDMLGNSVIARGSIGGFIKDDRKTTLQVDAGRRKLS